MDTSGCFSAAGLGVASGIHKTEAGSSQRCSRSYLAFPFAFWGRARWSTESACGDGRQRSTTQLSAASS